MTRKLADMRVLELIDHFGKKDNSFLPVEFFFFADRQDDAGNLAIELHKLGYEVYRVHEPDDISSQWSIVGATPRMKMDDESVCEWSEKMEQLAQENNSRFDGWGTLLDPDPE